MKYQITDHMRAKTTEVSPRHDTLTNYPSKIKEGLHANTQTLLKTQLNSQINKMPICNKLKCGVRLTTLAILLSGASLFASSGVFAAPASADLIAYQTPIKNQGLRGSCITFSSTAALEAAYKRAGYGDLDLSEEFFQYVSKMFWLHEWDSQKNRQADDEETQLGFTAGGSGSDYLGRVANGFRIPTEDDWKYKESNYSANDHPAIANNYDSSYWGKQKTKSDFNLDGGILKKEHLTADLYYSGTGFTKIPISTNNPAAAINAIEDQLAAQREVVIDLHMKYEMRNRNNKYARMMDVCDGCKSDGGHSMLAVGYDRTSPDPRQHYFIVKNSWGVGDHTKPGTTTRANGYTYVSYDMLKENLYGASYITGVTEPAPWLELANVGRWETNMDGWKGTLDIYHIPGMMKQPWADRNITMQDRRIGTFYNHEGTAYRVNGEMRGRQITFWIDGNNPHLPYDRLQGTKYTMNRLGDDLIVGSYKNPAGRTYAGYLKRKHSNAFFEPAVRQNAKPSDTVGLWSMNYGSYGNSKQPFCISSVRRGVLFDFVRGQGMHPVTGWFSNMENGRRFRLSGVYHTDANDYIDVYRMSWHADIATGARYSESGQLKHGVILKKVSDRCS